MLIPANQTEPGKQYKTAKGVTIQIAVSARPQKVNTGLRHRYDGMGNILAHVVADGVVDYKRFVPIPPVYTLEDGLPDTRRPVESGPRLIGRPVLPKSQWRGPARRSPIPDTFLTAGRTAGCYVVETAHYFLVGYSGRSLFAVFRNGTLGFRRAYPANPDYRALPVKQVEDGGRFMGYRVSLKDLTAQRVADRALKFITYVCARTKDVKGSEVV